MLCLPMHVVVWKMCFDLLTGLSLLMKLINLYFAEKILAKIFHACFFSLQIMQFIFSLNETVSLILRSASPNIMPEYLKELAMLTSIISPVFGHCKFSVFFIANFLKQVLKKNLLLILFQFNFCAWILIKYWRIVVLND